MKALNYYKKLNLDSSEQVFDYLISTLRPGITDWGYFVDWNKVFKNTRDVESTLNTMNYLLGKSDFDSEFRYLANKHPEIVKMIPVLIVRNGANSKNYQVSILDGTILNNELFDFSITQPSQDDIEKALTFINKSGLIRIFKTDGVKNLVDYVLGVEAGLNSNGRKNRSGTAMENVCEALIKSYGIDYKSQVRANDISKYFGIDMSGLNGRMFDFVAKVNDILYIFEVNCYSGGGSKLDKTASDYRELQDDLNGKAVFIWITEGHGWYTAKNPLHKTFDHNDHVLNTEMINGGALKEILNI